jgi:hypothetical protein
MTTKRIELIPKVGDFSFIDNDFLRESLECDYNNKYYSKHTTNSFEKNLNLINYIKTYGWANFYINYSKFNVLVPF